MVMLGLFCLILGMAIGQRFKVLMLLPGMAVSTVLALGVGIAQLGTAWSMVLLVATSIASLQTGYLVGIVLRYAPIAARASRLRADALPGSMPTRHPAH